MIYVTHDQVEAMTLADRIVVLNEGARGAGRGAARALHRPRNMFVAAFIGSPRMNLLPGRVSGQAGDSVDVVLAGGGRARSAVGGSGNSAVTVGVRPEHLHEGAGDGLSLEAEVEAVEHLGKSSTLYLAQADGTRLAMRAGGTSPRRPGERVTLGTPVDCVHLFGADGVAVRP